MMMGGRLLKREVGTTMPIDKNHNMKQIIVGRVGLFFLTFASEGPGNVTSSPGCEDER